MIGVVMTEHFSLNSITLPIRYPAINNLEGLLLTLIVDVYESIKLQHLMIKDRPSLYRERFDLSKNITWGSSHQ